MGSKSIHPISPFSLVLIIIPEILGILGIIIYLNSHNTVIVIIALFSFILLFILVFIVGRCFVFLTLMTILISIPIALFVITPWYMGFLISFVSAYGIILLALLISQTFDRTDPPDKLGPSSRNKAKSNLFDVEQNINN